MEQMSQVMLQSNSSLVRNFVLPRTHKSKKRKREGEDLNEDDTFAPEELKVGKI